MGDYIIPGIIVLTALFGQRKRVDVYDALVTGAGEGLSLLKTIVPSLVILLTAITMLRESGFFDALAQLLAPICGVIGIPPETMPLLLIRPFSGSAALAVGAELMAQYGVDSLVGKTAAVMLGSTETTFYTLGVYYGAAGIRDSRYTLWAALVADLTAFLSAAMFTRLLTVL